MSFKFVQTSDWHMSGGLTQIFPQKALEKQLIEVRKPIVHAMEACIKHVVITGDISDKARLDEDSLIALITLFSTYSKYVKFHYIAGNHDFAHVGKTSVDVLKLFADTGAIKGLNIYTAPTIVELEGVDACFMPFPHNKLPDNDRPLLIFAHIEEAGAKGDNGLVLKNASLTLSREPEDFVCSGHLHTYQFLKKSRVLFCGSPYQKTFGEPLPKGFVVAKARYSGGLLKVEHEFIDAHPSFRLENVTITESKQWKELEVGEHVFYKVTLGEGIVAPKNITRDIPNIVYLKGSTFKGRATIELGDGEQKTDADLPKITPLTGLVDMLHSYELDKREVKRAVGMVKEAIEHLNVQASVSVQ